MPNSNKEMQDQRTNSSMEDSNTMTIEFLRARLLSERSVSKSARQRADELARRVAELEEQLKIVSLQRKKAEKATAGVLAILENNGISEVSDAYDSSSDMETPCGSEVGNNFKKEDGNLNDSRFSRNESVALSGSDNDFSPVSQSGLSWDGRRGTKHSLEKYRDPYLRRRSSFASSGSSSLNKCVGKSCRQITRREPKSAVEQHKTDLIKVDSQKSEVDTYLDAERKPEILRGSETQEARNIGEGSDSDCFENEKLVTNVDTYFNGHGEDRVMEKALEDQAKLIGRFEEMEKAQREWEERFRENNSSTPDSCDPGNRSDVTEEREEIKAQVQCHTGTVSSHVQEAMSEFHACNGLSNTESSGFLPPQGDQMCSTPASESLPQDFAFSLTIVKHNQENLDSNHCARSHSTHHHGHPYGSTEKQSSQVVSSNTSNCSGPSGREVSGSQNEHFALVPHQTSSGFSEVLEALKQAKLSLHQKMSSLSLVDSESVGKAVKFSLPPSEVWDRVEKPVGCSGLFRVPTDYAVEASKTNFLVSSSQPNSANYNPAYSLGVVSDQIFSKSLMDSRYTFTADNLQPTGDLFLTRPTVDTRSSYSIQDRLLTSQYNDTGSRIYTMTPSFDSNLDGGVPSFRQHTYPLISSYRDTMQLVSSSESSSTFLQPRSVEMSSNFDVGVSSSSQHAYRNQSTYPDLMPQTLTRSGRSVGMPPANHLPFHNVNRRPYLYR